ncbi:MAG TPA: hypothetical protein DEO38_04975 [Bacteroidales bacterium]|nr:hypothetical protein [Bacteroidales bacterium]
MKSNTYNYHPLYLTNLWGTINDNFLKTLSCFVAIKWVDEQYQSLVVSIAAAMLVLPYVFCSPLAGRLTQHYSKRRIVQVAKLVELPIVLIAILGFVYKSIAVVILALFLMGLQSSLYSPAKYGLVREIGGVDDVSRGMGGMESISFFAMLMGTVIAGVVVDTTSPLTQYILLLVFAILGLLHSLTIRANEERTHSRDRVNPIAFLRQSHEKAKKYPGLNPIIYTLSVFWWLAATVQISVLIYCQQALGMDSMTTGFTLCAAAIGISLGCVMAGYVGKKHFLLGWVPYLGWGISFLLFMIFAVKMSPWFFGVMMFVMSFVCGFFKIPLDAEIQRLVRGSELNTILAYFNQVSFIFILLASATFALITWFLPVRYIYLFASLVFFCVPWYIVLRCRPMVCYACHILWRRRYHVTFTGLEHLRTPGAHLLMPNHQAVMDPMLIFSELYDMQLRPLVDEAYFITDATSRILNMLNAVPVPNLKKHRDGVEQAERLNNIILDTLRAGDNILVYPSGHITTDGRETIGNRQLAYNVCRQLPDNTTVLLAHINGLWGSSWSRKGKNRTPVFATTLLVSIIKMFTGYCLFHKKREVTIDIVPMTEQVKHWAQTLNRQDFNKQLENWYNSSLS